MYAHILVPVDGSSFSERAIPYARAIAQRAEARLHTVLVHTAIARQLAEMAPTPLSAQWEDEYRAQEARYLDGLVADLKGGGVDAVAERMEGDAAHELIDRAKSGAADLLVMATHGRGGIERAWLGSVADEVVHHVRLPAVLVRPREDESPPGDPTLEHIVAATDGSEAAEAAARQAIDLARLFDARVTLLRVVYFPAGMSSPYIPHAARLDQETTERREREARKALDEMAARLGDGIHLGTRVVIGYHPARAILDAIPEIGCDLIALGTHRRARLARIVLGSVADKVVRASPVPVLVGHTSD